MSIVRIGMSEDNKFADGYDAIFGKSSNTSNGVGKSAKKPAVKKMAGKKPVAKKPAKKK